MNEEWVKTGEAARILGVSRQHVVDLCDRGDLTFSKVGSHRRIPRSAVDIMLRRPLTREEEKSLWLHRALLTPLMLDPNSVLQAARKTIDEWRPKHRSDGMVSHYLDLWEYVIDKGIDEVVSVLTGRDERSVELRQNSPFAGVLSDDERRRVLQSFREHRSEEIPAA